MSLLLSIIILFFIPEVSSKGRQEYAHQHNSATDKLQHVLSHRGLKKDQFDGTKELSRKERTDMEVTFSEYSSKISQQDLNAAKDGRVNIDVYWNTLTTSEGIGALSVDIIETQIQVLNDAFSGATPSYESCGFSYDNATLKHTPFRFTLVEINEFDGYNDLNYIDDNQTELSELHQGNCSDLNIYSGIYGYRGSSSSPWNCHEFPLDDGIIIDYRTLPDQNWGYEGVTLVQQVGHWLGLYNVYEGGCDDGDFVIDTPAQRTSYQCTSTKNTCRSPETPGNDLLHNFMDNKRDCCRYSFTNGQIERMILQARLYRDLNANVTLPTVLPLTCDFPEDGLNYSQCDVENPCWIRDGYCDYGTEDGYNTEGCHSDGGDCICDFPDDGFDYSACNKTHACMIENGECDWELELLNECNNDRYDCSYFDDDCSGYVCVMSPTLQLLVFLVGGMLIVCVLPCMPGLILLQLFDYVFNSFSLLVGG